MPHRERLQSVALGEAGPMDPYSHTRNQGMLQHRDQLRDCETDPHEQLVVNSVEHSPLYNCPNGDLHRLSSHTVSVIVRRTVTVLA
jgi:hypothetical protein